METRDASSQRETVDEKARCPEISAYSTTKERTVFTESGNGDGWIATNLTVEPTE